MTLANNLEGVQYVDAKWSPDSHLAIVVISYVRGSGVEAAYLDGSGWHKALQSDTDLPVAELARQSRCFRPSSGSTVPARRLARFAKDHR